MKLDYPELAEFLSKILNKKINNANFVVYKLEWKDFTAKNRIAHSTKKQLLLAIVDEEGDVSYYQSDWLGL